MTCSNPYSQCQGVSVFNILLKVANKCVSAWENTSDGEILTRTIILHLHLLI